MLYHVYFRWSQRKPAMRTVLFLCWGLQNRLVCLLWSWIWCFYWGPCKDSFFLWFLLIPGPVGVSLVLRHMHLIFIEGAVIFWRIKLSILIDWCTCAIYTILTVTFFFLLWIEFIPAFCLVQNNFFQLLPAPCEEEISSYVKVYTELQLIWVTFL